MRAPVTVGDMRAQLEADTAEPRESEAMLQTDLVVVGAGAKAAALAAKVHAINALGLGPIDLTIVESTEVAASWTGLNGYTSGTEYLALTPAKDVGFPYESVVELGEHGYEIDGALIPFSWQRYLIDTRSYARWIDAGSPTVQHHQYGRYLRWVLSRAKEGVRLIGGEVERVSLDASGERWRLDVRRPEGMLRCGSEAMVMTGPGFHRELPHDPEAGSRIFYCDSRRPELAKIPTGKPCDIAIVGGGESALSSLLFLRDFRPEARLTIYTPTMPLSRGESFLENRVFSTPDVVAWESIGLQERREFIKQCDRGVFGPEGLAEISYDERYGFVHGRVTHIAAAGSGEGVLVEHRTVDGLKVGEHDYLVNCIGFDLLPQLSSLLDPDAWAAVERCAGPGWDSTQQLETKFGRSLEIEGLLPRLHVPALAALSQGPGFSNLGCLGLLANRVLQPLYVKRRGE